MSFLSFLKQNWAEFSGLLRQHLWLVFISTLVAVAIGLPTGILLTRKKSLRGPVLGIANVMQTIPSLALFGFLIPLPFIGGIGARTAIVALVLYALAKAAELLDSSIFEATSGIISGHTLKHLLAVSGIAVILAMLLIRKPASRAAL